MAYNIKWTEKAVDDLEKIIEFIEKDSYFYACSLANTIINKIEILKDFPFMGRIVPEENLENIREIFIKNYRIIYEIIGKEIYILAIIHGKMLYQKTDEE